MPIFEMTSKYISHFFEPTQTLTVRTLGSLQGRVWNDVEQATLLEYIWKRDGINISIPLYQDGNTTTSLVDVDGISMIQKIQVALAEDKNIDDSNSTKK